MLRVNARADDLILVGISALLQRDPDRLCFPLAEGRESLALVEVIERLTGGEWLSLVVLEGVWPLDKVSFPGPDHPLVKKELLGYSRDGLALIAAVLPASEAQVAGWPFFGRWLEKGLRGGAADLNQDGAITVAELCDYAAREIQPVNEEAMRQRAAGHPAHVVPLPRLLAGPAVRNLVLAVRPRHPDGAEQVPPSPSPT
jgi:hypothetical protein